MGLDDAIAARQAELAAHSAAADLNRQQVEASSKQFAALAVEAELPADFEIQGIKGWYLTFSHQHWLVDLTGQIHAVRSEYRESEAKYYHSLPRDNSVPAAANLEAAMAARLFPYSPPAS